MIITTRPYSLDNFDFFALRRGSMACGLLGPFDFLDMTLHVHMNIHIHIHTSQRRSIYAAVFVTAAKKVVAGGDDMNLKNR